MEQFEPEKQHGDMEEKRQMMNKRIEERDRLRVVEATKKRMAEEDDHPESENVHFFMQSFKSLQQKVLEDLDILSRKTKPAISDFDDLSILVQELQKYVSDSSLFLSKFDINKYQGLTADLVETIAIQKEKSIPKKKFAFKNKGNREKSSVTITKSTTETEVAGLADSNAAIAASCEYLVRNKSAEVIIVSEIDADGKDVNISSLNDCTVSILGVTSTIHLTNLNNCTVKAVPCSRSIFLDKCTRCTLVLACQQLRIHETTDSKFYIHVTSRAIIEDSNELKFSPYSLTHSNIEEKFNCASLNLHTNNWSQVNDFNWLVAGQQSPNWSILDESEREQFNL